MKTVTVCGFRNPGLRVTLLALGLCCWSSVSHASAATAGLTVPAVAAALRPQGVDPGFLVATPLVEHHQRRFRIGIEYTLRLPSGAIVTQAPAWSAETHAAGNLSTAYQVPGFSVPSLHGTWYSRSRQWQLSLWVTDLTKENLFTNIADLSTTDANRLQQWPDRHWWFSVKRRF